VAYYRLKRFGVRYIEELERCPMWIEPFRRYSAVHRHFALAILAIILVGRNCHGHRNPRGWDYWQRLIWF
jgi:hypothetical protein